MENLILNSAYTLGAIGLIASAILYIAATKFKVIEDPRIDQIESILPAANCGGCGYAGCRQFAEACTKAQELTLLFCPVGGSACMSQVASIMGMTVEAKAPMIAVLRCNGSKVNAPDKINYDGAKNCRSAHSLFAGTSGCAYGCLGFGDCAVVCNFDALHVDSVTGLPVVDENKCTSCGACIKACPRGLFELRPKGPNGQRVLVACMNKEKGPLAKKNCAVACIGCTKCTKVTGDDQVKVQNFLSYIPTSVDAQKFGKALVASCPTKAICGVNLPEGNEEENKLSPV